MPHRLLSKDSPAETGERQRLLQNVSAGNDVDFAPGEGRTTQGQGTTWYASVFIVVNAALGAGLLNFPAAYDQSGGILVAILVQAVLMVFIIGALVILAYCSDLNQSATYQDVVDTMCGTFAKHVCSFTVALYCFGTCVTFFIIIADQWDSFLTRVYGEDFCHYWYMNRKFTMSVTSVLLILPLCFSKRIDFLKYASALGVLGVVYCVLLITIKYFVGPINPGPIKTSPDEWTDVFIVVPVICFGYQCHVSVVPIYSCMAKRTVPEFLKTILIAIFICVLTYSLTAVFGYLTFGSKVNSDILLSYKPTPEVLAGVILIAAKMYTTYPILLFCGRAAFDSVWVAIWRMGEVAELTEKRRRIITTLVWFTASLAMALFVPNIGTVISVLGSLAAIFIFFYPGMCLLQVLLGGYVKYEESPVKYVLLYAMAVMYLIIGAFIFAVVMTQSIWNDIAYAALRPREDNAPCVAV